MKLWHARGVAALLTLTLWACGDATGSLEQAAYPDASAEPTPDAAEGPGVQIGGTDAGTDTGGTLPDGTPIGP